MISLQLNNFQDGANCKSILFTSKESFVRVTHRFLGGNAYGFISDFGCGSWGLVTCLGGRCENPDGEVLLNAQPIACSELLKYSCFISENVFNGINTSDNLLSAKECIEKALQISKISYSVQEIKIMFGLSDERFERNLNYVSGEIWRISMAVGFAYGKDIFCFPWLNERDVDRLYQPLINILKKNGKIILIPSSQKKPLKKICDETLLMGIGKGEILLK